MSITPEQYDVLMRPLNRSRVKTLKGMSYLEAWDVRAHLIRVFGFGGFSVTADEAECVSHREVPQSKDASKTNHEVCWKVRVSLVIPALNSVYTEYAIGSSSQPSLPEAHDMAIKTAESDGLKRAAINLGTQFGLSLYDDGTLQNVIQKTLVVPDGVDIDPMSVEEIQSTLGGTVDTDTGEIAETHNVSPTVESLLEALRETRLVTDNTERITTVAALKTQYAAVLGDTTEVNGNTITLARLADQVAQGAV